MRIALISLMTLALAGCGVELLASTATQSTLQAEQLKAVQGQVGHAAESTGKINLQRAIDTYYAEKGSYPHTLQMLSPDYIPSVPTHVDGTPYGYDPATGKLTDSPMAMPALAADGMSDDQKMAQIREAINKFGMTVKYYPGSLQALVPAYLPAVPKASNGLDFIYNPQNGALTNPAGANQAPMPHPGMARRPAGSAGGGAGPMGETMTGIGISNQLDSMSNAGSASAGSYARRGIANAQQQHNQQQERALKDLGD